MRVVLDSSLRSRGGVARHLLELAGGLRQMGIEVSLAVPTDAHWLRAQAREQDLAVIRQDALRSADIVHYHLGDTFDRGALGRIARQKALSGVVITEHLPHSNASDPALLNGGRRPWVTGAKTAFKRLEFSLADRTIVLSRSCRRFVISRYGAAPQALRLVPNGIPEPPSVAAERSWGGVRIVAAGSLIAQKGFDVLVRAAADARRWTVELFGDGPARPQLEALSRELGAPVLFRGWRPAHEIELRRATVVCVPSRWEALPYLALEAMWAGAPLVASRVDGLVDLIDQDETGLLVESGDHAALALAISGLVAQPERAERLARAAQARAAERFSYQAMLDGVRDVYLEVLGP